MCYSFISYYYTLLCMWEEYSLEIFGYPLWILPWYYGRGRKMGSFFPSLSFFPPKLYLIILKASDGEGETE